jgi:hypothetical protein
MDILGWRAIWRDKTLVGGVLGILKLGNRIFMGNNLALTLTLNTRHCLGIGYLGNGYIRYIVGN